MAAVPLSLQVGERKFITTKDTLSKSGFFAALLAGPWEGDLLMDGSYFIDADPDIFDFVLKYLRHGTFPLFYDKVRGHDYRLYLAVLEQSLFTGGIQRRAGGNASRHKALQSVNMKKNSPSRLSR
ncbi:MAG: hypothetical protein Q9195_003441 [Heterodermia aff. obscurata]